MTQDTFIPTRPTGTVFPKWTESADYRIISLDNVAEALREIVEARVVAWDSEFKPTHAGHIVSAFSFSTKPNAGWLLPVGMHHIENLPLSIVRRFLFATAHHQKDRDLRNIVQNEEAERRSVKALFPDDFEALCRPTDDIQILWYIRDPNEAKDFKEARPKSRGSAQPQGFSLHAMALKYLKVEIPDLGDYFGKQGGTFAELDPDIARVYAGSDADVTLRLYLKGVDPEIDRSFIYQLDTQTKFGPLFDMEELGVWFDSERLSDVEKEARGHVADARSQAYEALQLPPDTNLDSVAKLSDHIYNVLGWTPKGKKGKSGRFPVDKMSLGRYAESADAAQARAAEAVLYYRTWKTLHNNFLTKLHEYVNPHTGAIHASFLSTIVPTGRLACASPNLQQIPKHTKVPLRRAFRARPGYYFLEVDYSQIELRVYAGETQENYFFESFLNDTDLHLKTASIIYRESITEKKDPRRQMGKTMNFGPIYGMKPEGLAARTDYDVYEAQRILDDFFAAMPDAVKWTAEIHRKAKQMGGVHTHFGRWRPLPWLHSRIAHEVEFGERSAVNTIVQGTAADIMKIGMVRLWKALKDPKCKFNARLVLTVHDSFLLEVADGTPLEDFMPFVTDKLCFPIDGYPPLTVDAEWGRNWFDMDKVKIDQEPPEAEPQKQLEKEIPFPDLSPDDSAKLAVILRDATKNGEISVSFKKADGTYLTDKPVQMDAQTYQRTLQFLVDAARRSATNGSHSHTTPPVQVSFS